MEVGLRCDNSGTVADGETTAMAQSLSAVRRRPRVPVRAFAQLTGEDNKTMGNINDGKDGNARWQAG